MRQDTAVDFISHFNDMRAEYRMLQTGPNKKVRNGLVSSGSGADFQLNNESQYMRMMEISRDIFQNDPIVGKGIKRLVSNVIGNGFNPDPDTGDELVDVALKEKWDEFAERPEIQGRYNFVDLERITLQSLLRDGDILHVTSLDDDGVGRLEAFEGHQLRNPRDIRGKNIFFGVELDANRRRLNYYIDPSSNGASAATAASVRVSAFRDDGIPICLHVCLPDRLTQTRGIPVIQPTVDFISYHDHIQFAQLVKQQTSSCFVILKSRAADGPVFGSRSSTAEAETFSDGKSRQTEELFPGKQISGAPGENISGFSPNVPNQEYFQHVSLILQIIAVNLDLPAQILLLDPTQTNFSGWRGALDQAKQRWKEIQSSYISAFHSKVWAWKVDEWAKTETFFAKSAYRLQHYSRAIWQPPTWPYIEPLKDAQADAYAIQARLNSPRRVFALRGLDYDDILPESIADNSEAIIQAKVAAQNINSRFNDDSPVDWREVLSVPIPQIINQSWTRSEQTTGDANGST